jgi:hypothetical protein
MAVAKSGIQRTASDERSCKEKGIPIGASDKKWNIEDAKYRQMKADGIWLMDYAIWLNRIAHTHKEETPRQGLQRDFYY